MVVDLCVLYWPDCLQLAGLFTAGQTVFSWPDCLQLAGLILQGVLAHALR